MFVRGLCNSLLVAVLAASPIAYARGSRAVASAPSPLKYELSFERPNTHLLNVTIHTSDLKGATVDFAMPDWAPGSYYLENYSANVQRFRATSADGKELAWRKTDSQTWRVELAGAHEVRVSYQIFANTLQNNIAQYNERHAFIGGPSVWMYLVGGKERPVELSIAVPTGWKVATGMEHASSGAAGGGGTTTFRAADYNWFADAPLELSDFAEKDFELFGTTYHVIVHDVVGKAEFAAFADGVQKAVAQIVTMWQPVAGVGTQAAPFKDYYFIFHIWPRAGGGLEHLNSTQIDFSKDWDSKDPAPGYGDQAALKLFVTAHEFFHAWNVKRLRPLPLGPFDYSQMVHTPSLWISEGLTSYYGSLALLRAGIITPAQYLDNIGQLITKFEAEPGRGERSIEDTSWDTWYSRNTVQQENNLRNTNYSYYDGGQVMGHILDFAIRHDTKNQKSLDDWMRLLYARYALPKPGFQPDDAVKAASEIAGTDISPLFSKYIAGKEAIPYELYFAYAGISVEKKIDDTKAWIGISTTASDDAHVKIQNVTPGGPGDLGGLDFNDLIYAIDGRVTDPDGFAKTIAAHKPGDTVKITVLRLGEFHDFTISLTANPSPTYTLKLIEHPSDEQKAIYDSWIGNK
jgi:predicted metalloprotease with PDZ domain